MSAFCDGWSSDSSSSVGLSSSLKKRQLLGQEKSNCNKLYIVLCIELTYRDGGSRRRRRLKRTTTTAAAFENDQDFLPSSEEVLSEEEYYDMIRSLDDTNADYIP